MEACSPGDDCGNDAVKLREIVGDDTTIPMNPSNERDGDDGWILEEKGRFLR